MNIVQNRVMVFVDDIWRVATILPATQTPEGDIQAELNGLAVLVKNGRWYHISERMTDEQIRASTIQNNIDQLYQTINRKAAHRKTQERNAELRRQQEELERQRAANPQPAAQPQPVVIPAQVEETEYVDFVEEYGECDCEDCRRARGDL